MPRYKYSRDDYYTLMNLPCIDVALALGMEINEKESSSKAYKIKGEQGLHIFRDGGNTWFKFSNGHKGFPIDLVKETLGYDDEQALDFLARYAGISPQSGNSSFQKSSVPPPIPRPPKREISEKEKKEFIVPPHSVQPKRVMAYLIKTRGIDPDIVKAMIQRRMIAEDDIHHNCLFFGRDKDGNILSCGLRGTATSTPFRGEVGGGNKEYSFAMQGRNQILRLFESPIDAMSHATFTKLLGRDWTADHRLSVNGSGCYDSIKRYLTDHPEIKGVWFCYDNDEGGYKGMEATIPKLEQDFADRDIKVRIAVPFHGCKDWNEDLQKFRQLHNVSAADYLDYHPRCSPHSPTPPSTPIQEDTAEADEEEFEP